MIKCPMCQKQCAPDEMRYPHDTRYIAESAQEKVCESCIDSMGEHFEERKAEGYPAQLVRELNSTNPWMRI